MNNDLPSSERECEDVPLAASTTERNKPEPPVKQLRPTRLLGTTSDFVSFDPDETSGSASLYFKRARARAVPTRHNGPPSRSRAGLRRPSSSSSTGDDDSNPAHEAEANDEEVLTVDEVAARMRRDRKSIYQSIRSGEFPGVMPGRPVRILWSAVVAFASTGQGRAPKKRGRS